MKLEVLELNGILPMQKRNEHMYQEVLKPKKLNPGDTIGVFTPSSPAYIDNEGLFLNGIRNLEACGFKIKQGSVTSKRLTEGYRSAHPQERAKEFMDLILDPDVHCLMSTIGGYNSSSMIPYLDFQAIRSSRKPICGYSDVTSLHASIITTAGLRTFYGPSVMCWFGDWPNGVPESTVSASIHPCLAGQDLIDRQRFTLLGSDQPDQPH